MRCVWWRMRPCMLGCTSPLPRPPLFLLPLLLPLSLSLLLQPLRVSSARLSSSHFKLTPSRKNL